MALAPISIKVEERVRERIERLIEEGRYRTVSDFMHRAISAELDRATGRRTDMQVADMRAAIREELFKGMYDDLIEERLRVILAGMAQPRGDPVETS